MSDQSAAVPDSDYDQELVAYLDGELEHEEMERVEQRLATDVQYRLRLQQLQRTWDMLLDDLPRAEASERFAASTVEMVAVRAIEEQAPRKRSARWMWAGLGLVSVAAAGTVGFALTSYWLNEPNRRLLQDLPVIEHLDMYQNAESVEFLRRLSQEGLFDDETSNELNEL